jgi:F-box interacting protein
MLMLDYIPKEVILNILSQLPVKSLIRFRCVSKTWFSLITSHDFITMHLNRALSKAQHPPHLLFRHYDQKMEKESFTLLSSNNCFPRNHVSKLKGGYFACPSSDFIELHCPHKRFTKQFLSIVGSSNGLVCLLDDDPSNSGHDIVPLLWNPSIHKSIFLPSPGVKFPPFCTPQFLGFGYDPKTEDYKLVRLEYKDEVDDEVLKPYQSLVHIYTLRTGVWRTITSPCPGARLIIPYQFLSVFVNGAVHWLAHTDYDNIDYQTFVILSFDIGDEIFREMALPKSLEEADEFNSRVAVLGGSLAFVKSAIDDSNHYETCYSLWMMKEYGVAESWTKLFDIDAGVQISRVVGFAKIGEVLVTNAGNGKLLSYNPSSRWTLTIHIHAKSSSFYLDTYRESLVLPNVEDGALGGRMN